MYDVEFLDLPPLDGAAGTVRLPGSKSISNRVLLLAALCEGRTRIDDLLDSDDTRVMLDALAQLGCAIERRDGQTWIEGLGPRAPRSPADLFLGNAGTAMRPLTAALAVLGGEFTVRGVARMHERPIADLVDALRKLGCQIEDLGNPGYPPLRIGRPTLRLDQPIPVRGDVSSQFLTALLMAMPLVSTRDVVIEVIGELISKPYIDITLNLMARFGVQVKREGWSRFTIAAGSRYASPGQIAVEGDASSASYFVALGAIAASRNAPVRILGTGSASIQGDIRFVQAAQAMGAAVECDANAIRAWRGSWPLKAVDLDCNHIPDAAMTLAVMALYADGPTTLRNIGSWRVKETDRIEAMATELRKLGAVVEAGADFLRVEPPKPDAWRSASIATYDDHRMAMCFSLAAFNRHAAGSGGVTVRIQDPRCVGKTFPDYFETLFRTVTVRSSQIPVICVDGPTASGKGTLASEVAARLGWHYLDSGALYRLTALAAIRAGIGPDDASGAARLAQQLDVRFEGQQIRLGGEDVTQAIRDEAVGNLASRLSALGAVRQALMERQLAFRQLPGLVADGRDMGTVVFPDAPLKVYLTASAAQRALRRHKQLISKGIPAILEDLRADLEARDARDMSRSVAPLKPAADALMLDNSELGVDESVDTVLGWWRQRCPVS